MVRVLFIMLTAHLRCFYYYLYLAPTNELSVWPDLFSRLLRKKLFAMSYENLAQIAIGMGFIG
jgi:hypothetical protein